MNAVTPCAPNHARSRHRRQYSLSQLAEAFAAQATRRGALAALFALALGLAPASSGEVETAAIQRDDILAALGCGLRAPDRATLAPIITFGPYSALLIGSSSTDGIGASHPKNGYPARTSFHLNQQAGQPTEAARITLEAAGIGGEKSDAALARLAAKLGESRPDLLVWQVGTNDALGNVPLAALQDTIEQGLAIARRQAVPVVLIDPQYFPRIKDNEHYARSVDLIERIAATHDVPLIQRYQRMRKAEGMGSGVMAALLAADRFHMSDLGHECLALDLATALKDAFAPALPDEPADTMASAGKAKP